MAEEKIISEDLLQQSILKYIRENIEKPYGVRMLFCAETGSRGYSTHIPTSDMDVKGIFVCINENDYLSVKDQKKLIHTTGSELVLLDGTVMELDYTFVEVRKFLKRKVRGGKIDQFNLWVKSKRVYINEFDADTFDLFQNGFKLPFTALNGHLKTFLKIFSKKPNASSKAPTDKFKVKEILNSIVVGCMHLHMILFQKSPIYDTWEQMSHLQNHLEDSISKSVSVSTALEGLPEIKKIALELYETKKSARLGEIDVVDERILAWLNAVIQQYKEFNVAHLPADYHDSPEISNDTANETFTKLREYAMRSEIGLATIDS